MIIWVVIGTIIICWLGWRFYRKRSVIGDETDRNKAIRLVLEAISGLEDGETYSVESVMPYSVNDLNSWNVRLKSGSRTLTATVNLKEDSVTDISHLV
jgi:hypothetical protein